MENLASLAPWVLFRLSKLNQPKFVAALDNLWHFIQMNSSDPGWSNTNGDVTDLRSVHLLPVCGLWIICGPVGPRSSDLFVKEFDKKGSCITVNAPISSKNPFTAKEEGTCFFNMCLLKSTQKRRHSAWLELCTPEENLYLKWIFEYFKICRSQCKMVSEVRFLFWCLQIGFMVACELWLSQTVTVLNNLSSLNILMDIWITESKRVFVKNAKTSASSVREPSLERA